MTFSVKWEDCLQLQIGWIAFTGGLGLGFSHGELLVGRYSLGHFYFEKYNESAFMLKHAK